MSGNDRHRVTACFPPRLHKGCVLFSDRFSDRSAFQKCCQDKNLLYHLAYPNSHGFEHRLRPKGCSSTGYEQSVLRGAVWRMREVGQSKVERTGRMKGRGDESPCHSGVTWRDNG